VFLVFLHWLSLKYVRRRALKFANFRAMERFTGEKIISKNYVTLVLRLVTLLFLVLAISGMVVWYSGQSSESDFVLAIDASGSMLAVDYEPDRITAAKEAAGQFLDNLPEDSRVGVISFAGISFVKQTLTNNIGGAKNSVDGIVIESVGGTAIGDAIVSSSNLMASSDRAKTIVLLTDGQSNVGITIEEAIDYAIKEKITVNTVGIGTTEGGILQNTTFVSKLDTASLERVANETGGRFYMARDTEELSVIFREMATSSEQLISMEISSLLLILSLLFFFVEWFLTNTKYKTLP
jgi:Ca-activated chloride channel family protein